MQRRTRNRLGAHLLDRARDRYREIGIAPRFQDQILGALPETELGEVIFCAARLCGFLNPIEARDVIATVLKGLEKRCSPSYRSRS
jgi:hypothetical protein